MRKSPSLALIVFALTIGSGVAYFHLRPPSVPRFWLERMLNARKAGALVFVEIPESGDNFFFYVWDSKSPRRKAIYLGQLLYSSTQGSDSMFWSKDRMMCAEYSEGAEFFQHHSPWTTGYDWKTHQILRSGDIMRAFAAHGGKGTQLYPVKRRLATAQEIKLFDLKQQLRLYHLKRP